MARFSAAVMAGAVLLCVVAMAAAGYESESDLRELLADAPAPMPVAAAGLPASAITICFVLLFSLLHL